MPGLEGKTLDRYELWRLVGRGGMADVYEGYDPRFDRVVAVKVFKREDEEMLRRFIREAHLMASLSNPRLVAIYDAGASQIDNFTWYYIIMPFLEGGTLRARMRRSPLSLEEACRDLRDIANALDYIHSRGIVHRDIKASNVLLNAEGTCFLADFGIARTTSDVTQLTSTGNVLGTVEYVAPELFESNRKADARSDLYSLGVLLFEMVTGQLPFAAENQIALVSMHMNKRPPSPRSISSDISPQIERVIYKALEKKPEQRYGSATELAEAFCRAVSMRKENDVPANQTRSANRRPFIVAALALLVLLLVTVPVVYVITHPINGNSSAGYTSTQQTQTREATITQTAALTPTATPNATATARVIAAVTATARAQATAAAIAHMTATAQANASATAGVIQTATAGKPVYQDGLNNPNNADTQAANWDGLDGNDSHCVFASDGYHAKQNVSLFNQHACHESANQYQDGAISVDVNILKGHAGGVFFRFTKSPLGGYSGYLFEIDSKGNYKIAVFNAQILQDWTSTPALKTGFNVQNTLQVIMHGSTFLFYANGIFLVSLTDTTYQTGDIAFLAAAGSTNAEVVYSNLGIYSQSI